MEKPVVFKGPSSKMCLERTMIRLFRHYNSGKQTLVRFVSNWIFQI